MDTKTKEFIDMQDNFEKQLKEYPGLYVSGNIERASRDENGNIPGGQFYTNGEVSKLFTAYMLGYAFRDYLAR